MSDSATPSPVPTAKATPVSQEIKIVSHSSLLYWWPVWFFGFIFALWTMADNYRMAIIDHRSTIVIGKGDDGRRLVSIRVEGDTERLESDATPTKDDKNILEPKLLVSPRTWMGPLYFVIVFLVILITNVPLRGLWSLVTIFMIALLALGLSLFNKWDLVLKASGDLHVFMNMAGYLAISVGLFIAWFLAVYFFDRRTYILFIPGQIKACEEIGGQVKTYDTAGMALEKRRDDWFRHLILGFGTGDLTVRMAGAERGVIVLPNVAFIAFKIHAIEQMMAVKQISVRPS